MTLTAEIVKAKARELGADGVGIADAAVLDAHPPDPAHPQIPRRISPDIRSCVAFFKRIPAGAFRARDNACIHHVDQLVLREMDRVGYRIARFLEANGHWAFQTAAQETVWEMKNASYGSLSTRHVAIEAGLGTIGIGQGLLRVVGAFGDCPRCLAVCPVGDDYNRFLKDAQREIPEKTDAKVARARELLGIKKRGEPIRGRADGRVRWIGEDGYRPPARRAGAPA